ncbi:MAG: exodeoxyribonuclease VII large subunit [Prevotella sp.]|nr:exodeoxyribonuclease VII large subunit [Prevotella sp.]
MSEERYTLQLLNALVREAIEIELPDEYWVEAELSECRESRGHCYMELVEKDETSNTPIARASAKCWKQTWAMLQPYFERTTGQSLRAGMKVLLKVYAQFHEAFGFSWIVTDIDPTFTLGDMAQRRQAIIRKLKEEGVFDLQRELTIPRFCQRIAVISAETAAGYGDFCRQLTENEYGLQFEPTLFPAIMQGEQVEQSVIAALNSIHEQINDFDIVVIIRGGGSTSDMSGFDTLALAENVANFPLPIITGIGHDRDECVLDMVSNMRVKTPTAAAAFLISHLADTLQHVNDLQQRIAFLFSMVRTNMEHQLEQRYERLLHAIDQRLINERHHLELAEQKVISYDPSLLLKRGYSITLHNGKVVRDPQQLKEGDEIETRLEKGNIKSKVIYGREYEV